MNFFVGIILGALFGFLVGLLSFKIKSRWCTVCGSIKNCPRCTSRAASASAVLRPIPRHQQALPPPDQSAVTGGYRDRW